MLNRKTKVVSTLGLAFAGILALSGGASASATANPHADLVGSGCGKYIAHNPTGPSSIAAMENQTASEAIGNNPLLTEFSDAISGGYNDQVDLQQTLDNGEFTIFAPVDSAFADLDQATSDQLKTDIDFLISTVIYQVSPGQISPDDIVGVHPTIQGSNIEVTGHGNNLKVVGDSGEAKIICGGIKTENATIYLTDTVLFPPAREEEEPIEDGDPTIEEPVVEEG